MKESRRSHSVRSENPAGERRILAMMYPDLVGSTKKITEYELIEDAIMETFRDNVRVLAVRYGGQEQWEGGDGFLYLFRNGLSAVRCAVEIQNSIQRLCDFYHSGDMAQVRIGIHSGDVKFDQSGKCRGPALHIGSRVNKFAGKGGGIVLTRDVMDELVGHPEYHLDQIGARTLRGVKGRFEIYKLELLQEPRADHDSRRKGGTFRARRNKTEYRKATQIFREASTADDYARMCTRLHEDYSSVRVLAKTPGLFLSTERSLTPGRKRLFQTIDSRLKLGPGKYRLEYLFDHQNTVQELQGYLNRGENVLLHESRHMFEMALGIPNLILRSTDTGATVSMMIGGDEVVCMGHKERWAQWNSNGYEMRAPGVVKIAIETFDTLFERARPATIALFDLKSRRT